MAMFQKATRKQLRGRVAFDGPSGSGKTLTGLRCAFALGKRIAVIDTECGSASKYQGEKFDGNVFDFDVLELTHFACTEYTTAIQAAGKEGYDVLLIDSLSHAWSGEGGALDMKDKQGGNSFTAWAKITPMHRRMIDSILQSPCHVVATMRSKTEYVLETNDRGQAVPKKVGMAPVQREGVEYEFDLYGSLDLTHTVTITKSRCPALADQMSVKPGAAFFEPFVRWLGAGEAAPSPTAPATINKNQATKMYSLIQKAGIADAEFFEEYQITRLGELPAEHYEAAMNRLQRHIDDKAKNGAMQKT